MCDSSHACHVCVQCGSKAIFHIEAFLAKFMSVYKRYLLDSF